MRYLTIGIRPLAGILTLVFGLTMLAPPACAAEAAGVGEAPSSETTIVPQKVSLAAAAAARIEAIGPAEAATAAWQEPVPPPATVSTQSFFRTRKGAATLALMLGVMGYTIYSRLEKHIQSPGRE